MPIHDWTRVRAGTWHDFHLGWISQIQLYLNAGVLPSCYYAEAQPNAESVEEDVLIVPSSDKLLGGGITVADTPPRARLRDEDEVSEYVLKRRTVIIRHTSDDRMVALIELVSPGNKAGRHAFRAFVEKAAEALYRGYHLLIVDLFPPSPRDPQGIHAAIWGEFSDDAFPLPPGEPLTLAAYSAGPVKRAYVEPTAVGRELMEMPLFLESEIYVNVPLDETYGAAYRGVPQKWKRVLEESAA